MGVSTATAAAVAATAWGVGALSGYAMRGSKPAEPAGPATKVNDYVYGTATMPKQKKEAGADFDGDVYALGKVEEGAKLFKAKCATCHSVTANGPTMQGPNLYGIMGRPAAVRPVVFGARQLRHASSALEDDGEEAVAQHPAGMRG